MQCYPPRLRALLTRRLPSSLLRRSSVQDGAAPFGSRGFQSGGAFGSQGPVPHSPVRLMSPACLTVPAGGDDYWSGTVVWHNVMLTVRPCDALSSFARPGSSERSRRLVPGRRGPPLRIYRWEKTTAVAVKIKLKRLGKIRAPYYRIVIADSRTKRDGRAIEEIGKYHPKADPSFIEVDSERAQH